MKIDVNAGIIAKKPASSFGVGDIIMLQPNERAPADLILIHTKDKEGQVFIRTDQLDGETDWKVRRPMTSTQTQIENIRDVVNFLDAVVYCEQPNKEIYDFTGLYQIEDANGMVTKEPLTLENTMW
jgi:phospholipid-translocating ATPase